MTNKERLVKNEKLLRTRNTKATVAIKQYFRPDRNVADKPLAFNCECSNMDCGEAVEMTIHDYEKLHERRDRFVIVPGHETASVEKVISTHDGYAVVEKFSLDA